MTDIDQFFAAAIEKQYRIILETLHFTVYKIDYLKNMAYPLHNR